MFEPNFAGLLRNFAIFARNASGMVGFRARRKGQRRKFPQH